uniref:Protein kinase WEE1 n=1 Tax=Solanum tuberosum TaxID=4113 RepID=M1AT45_SOLTU
MKSEKISESEKGPSYVSQSAIALRYRVMPPPCIRNPYLGDASEIDADPFGNRRSKYPVFNPAISGNDGLSRYRTDFHEIEQIGSGNFSRVFKVFKRIDGCMYAVKHSTKQLHQDTDRRKALMEVQALAALEAIADSVCSNCKCSQAMMDPDPTRRPSAKSLVDNPIFERWQRNANK